jgi:hypothetical protein
MAYTLLKNAKNGKAVIHVVGAQASANVIVVGNNSTSNLAVGTEVLSHAHIRRVMWSGGTDAAPLILKRGATNVAFFTSTGDLRFNEMCALNQLSTANIDIVCTANAFIMVEVDKFFSNTTSEY